MRYVYNPSFDQMFSGDVDCAVLPRQGGYVAWTRTWEGPLRPDLPAAKADLNDVFAYTKRQGA